MRIRKVVTVVLALVVAGFVGTAMAQHEGHEHSGHDMDAKKKMAGPENVSFEGRIIGLSCYTMGMVGDKHATCAIGCAEKGLPVGVVAIKANKVYTLMLPSPKMAPYLEQMARVTGVVHSGHLLAPSKIELKNGDGWKAIVLPSAM